LPGKVYLTEDNKIWSACAPDTHKHIKKLQSIMTFGDDAIIMHTKNWFQGCIQVHILKNCCFWRGSLESLPNKNYLTEDSKIGQDLCQIHTNKQKLQLAVTFRDYAIVIWKVVLFFVNKCFNEWLSNIGAVPYKTCKTRSIHL
jgi:hypothetical protein